MTATTKTIIDHVCSNLKHKGFHMAIVDSPMSDHKQIYLAIKKYKSSPRKRVNYEAVNYEKLYENIKNTDYQSNDYNYENLEDYIKRGIRESKVTKTKILNLPQQDWICKDIINKIHERNIIWNQLRQDPENEELHKQFKSERNKTAQKIKNTKKKFYYGAFKKYTGNPKRMWKLINTLSNNKIKPHCTPPKLLTKDGPITDGNEICETFNVFFSTIGSTLANAIPTTQQIHHIDTTMHVTNNTNELTVFTPCQSDEISKIICNLDPDCSAGIDGITTKMIKCINNLVSDQLATCINEHLAKGIFPDALKIAKVTPIHKSGTKTDPNNYRPISVLPVISKIFEKVIYSRLDTYLNSVNFLYKRQYGFRSQSNTLSATADLITATQTNIDQKR